MIADLLFAIALVGFSGGVSVGIGLIATVLISRSKLRPSDSDEDPWISAW